MAAAACTACQQLPALLVALPLLAAFAGGPLRRLSRPLGAVLGPAVVALGLLLAARLALHVHAGGPLGVAIGGFPAPLGIVLRADLVSLVFVMLFQVLALLLWPRDSADPAREGTLTLVLVAAATGIALSGDLFNIYVFYEILAVASYGLAAARGTAAAYGAALRYLLLGAVGSALALLGIALIYATAGSLNLEHIATTSGDALASPVGLAAFVLILVGFGVKAELFPLNTWVPEVYAAATARVAGLLAGGVSKLALLAVLHVLTTIYAGTGAGLVLLVVGILTVATGELAALAARDFRRMLSYSSIGQLGLAVLAFSVAGTAGLVAGVALMAHHLLVKPALFLLADVWRGEIAAHAGGGRGAPLRVGLMVLLALSLIGVPPLPGFWAKYLLLTALLGDGGGLYALAAAVVLGAAVLEAAYLFAALRILLATPGGSAAARPGARAADFVPAALLGAVVAVLIAGAPPLLTGLEQAVGGGGAGLTALAAGGTTP